MRTSFKVFFRWNFFPPLRDFWDSILTVSQVTDLRFVDGSYDENSVVDKLRVGWGANGCSKRCPARAGGGSILSSYGPAPFSFCCWRLPDDRYKNQSVRFAAIMRCSCADAVVAAVAGPPAFVVVVVASKFINRGALRKWCWAPPLFCRHRLHRRHR